MGKAKKGKSDDIGDSILATMLAVKMKRNDSCISFVAVMEARSMNHKNQAWRDEWRNLIEQRFIQPATKSGKGGGVFTADYELTQKGDDRVGSPEQKEIKRLMETTVNSTAQEHDRIRKICMNNRAREIFDLLLKHGSMTRKELAATIGISDRGGPFSYGLRQLKRLGYIVVDEKNSQRGKKLLVLSDKAFFDPKDRPEPIPIDPETMNANIEKVYGKEMRKAAANKSSTKIEAKVKTETNTTMKTEHTGGDNCGIHKTENDKENSKRKSTESMDNRKEEPKKTKKSVLVKREDGNGAGDDDCLVDKHDKGAKGSPKGMPMSNVRVKQKEVTKE